MWLRVGLVTLLVGATVVAWQVGIHAQLSQQRVQLLVAQAGLLGPAVFIGLFILGELIQVPSVFFVFAAGVMWPFYIALPTAYIGALCAATVAFIVARHLVNDAVVKRLPERLRRYEERLTTHGLRTVLIIRLVFFMMPATHWLLGASRIRFRDLLLGTALGLFPGVLLLVAMGNGLLADWTAAQPWIWASIGILIAIQVVRHLQRRHAARAAQTEPGSRPIKLPS
jgi:phospholipase D1/2